MVKKQKVLELYSNFTDLITSHPPQSQGIPVTCQKETTFFSFLLRGAHLPVMPIKC